MVFHAASAGLGGNGGAYAHQRRVFSPISRQLRHVPGRGVVCLSVQPIGVFKVAAVHADPSGQVVHPPDALLFAAAGVRQRQGRIVAGA